MIRAWCLIALFSFAMATQTVRAVDLIEETDWGSQLFMQVFTVEGDFDGNKDKDAEWTWNLNYNYERSVTPQPDASDIVDDTDDFIAGFAWNGETGWGVSGNLEYSTTPQEDLVSRGGNFSLSYRWKYNGESVSDDSGFSPYLDFRLSAGTTNYLQSFSGSIPRLKNHTTRPVSGTAEIRQNMTGLTLGWKPVEDWKFKLGYEYNNYNRNVGQFEDNLDSSLALQAGMGGFSSTVGGLARVTYIADVAWQFAEFWKTDLNEAYAILAADESTSTTTKGIVEYHFAQRWRATAGVEYVNSEILKDVLGVVGLEWDID